MAELAKGTPAVEAGVASASPDTARTTRLMAVQRGVGVLVVLALVGLLVFLGYGLLRRQGGTFAGFAVNAVGKAVDVKVRPAPDFSLRLFDGKIFRLSEHRGQVVVVNYWASWCVPCREEARLLETPGEPTVTGELRWSA